MINFLKQWFFSGLFIIIPIIITINIFKFIINIISQWLMPLHFIIPLKLTVIPYIEIFIACIIITLIGYIATKFILNKLIEYIEEYLIRYIPFANTIYFGIKKIAKILQKKNSIDDSELVAWVRLPFKNIYCLGLMTGKVDPSISPDKNKIFYSFFVPTTPNPVTGYYVIAAESDCIFTNITRQEAISMIISGGIIKPER